MNRFQLVSGTVKAVAFVLLFLAQVMVAYGKDKDCWGEFFEHSQYQGKHFRVEGPVQLQSLSNINGENWDSHIDSLKVGPKAKVIIYENPNFKLTLTEMARYPDLMHSLGITEKDIKEDAEIFFNANAKIHDLSDFNFHGRVRSLKVECVQ